MKKIVLLAALFCFSGAHAQWNSKTDNDPFNGKSTLVTAIGSGGEFPYQKPVLGFRKAGNQIDAIVSGAGSTICEDVFVSFSFGDANNVLRFEGFGSKSNEAAFLNTANASAFLSLITGLKRKNVVYVLFETGCSSNRFQISLNGSTKALSTIFNKSWEDRINKKLSDSLEDLPDKIDELLMKSDFDCNGCANSEQMKKMKEFIIKEIKVPPSSLNAIDFITGKNKIILFVTIDGVEKEFEIN